MIGKRIRIYATLTSEHTPKILEGVVLDKVRALEGVSQKFPSGHGGTHSCDQQISIDFYIVQTEFGIATGKCTDLIEVLLKDDKEDE